MVFLGNLLIWAIHIYLWVIVIDIAVSWLIAFRVLDTKNPQARNLVGLLKRATDPVMKPVQKYIPPLGGIDISPIIVIIGLQLLSELVWQLFMTRPY